MQLKILLALLLVFFGTDFAHAGLKVDFTFKDLDDNVYTPASLEGSPVVLYVGSTF